MLAGAQGEDAPNAQEKHIPQGVPDSLKSRGITYVQPRTAFSDQIKTTDEYNTILSGDVTDLIFVTEKSLIKELAVDMLIHNYKPKVIIDYERIAYVEEITNVRVTFDMKISASYELESFLDGDYQSFYILPSGLNVLEVKFDDILPSHIRNIVESYSFKQGSFSKYYYGRKILDCYMR